MDGWIDGRKVEGTNFFFFFMFLLIVFRPMLITEGLCGFDFILGVKCSDSGQIFKGCFYLYRHGHGWVDAELEGAKFYSSHFPSCDHYEAFMLIRFYTCLKFLN